MTWASRLRATWAGDRRRWLLGAATLALLSSFVHPGVTLNRPRYDHIVVFDVTQSMNVRDQQLDGEAVSRLDFAKHAFRQALLTLPCGSKVGWAIFTEYRSFLLFAPVEVCANIGELRATLAHVGGAMAWSGNSEVAKGVHSAIGIAKLLPGTPSLVFVTDGQEAPPLNPRYRPQFDDKPGDIGGLLVGVGGSLPVPIPKSDALGRPLGFWKADEVMQTDPRSQGRGASVSGERLVDDGAAGGSTALGATPGSEHLSSLREAYLRLLAGEQGFSFLRLQQADALSAALQSAALAKPVPVRLDLQPALAALAFLLMLASSAGPVLQHLRRLRRASSKHKEKHKEKQMR